MKRIAILSLILGTLSSYSLYGQPDNFASRQNEEGDCPLSMYDIWGMGRQLYDRGEYHYAIEAFKEVIYMDPTYIEAYEYKGHALFWLRDYEGSLLDFNEAIRFYEDKMDREPKQGREVPHDLLLITHTDYDDKLEQLYNNRGTSYFEIGDYASAYIDFQQALAYNPGSKESKHNLDLAKKILKARGIPIPGTQPKDRLIDRIFASKVEYGDVRGNSTCDYLVVNRVELNRVSTLLHFQVFNPQDAEADIYISAKTNSGESFYLQGLEGSKYKLKKAFDQSNGDTKNFFIVGPGEEKSLVLEFERIPDNFEVVHLIEGNVDQVEACSIYDIQLK
ncbi:MAG: tetratricopeptide repeat protein [Bacteroidota bacterium]